MVAAVVLEGGECGAKPRVTRPAPVASVKAAMVRASFPVEGLQIVKQPFGLVMTQVDSDAVTIFTRIKTAERLTATRSEPAVVTC